MLSISAWFPQAIFVKFTEMPWNSFCHMWLNYLISALISTMHNCKLDVIEE